MPVSASVAIQQSRTRLRRFSPLIWLSLACLDAPIVAVVWQGLFASAFQAAISVPERIVLFVTAWLIYLTDRVSDSFTIPSKAPISARHEFCSKHRRILLVSVGFLAAAGASIGVRFIDRTTVVSGGVIALAIAVYMGVNHFAGFVWGKFPLKEALIGFLFALGTVSALHRIDLRFAIAVLVFGILCSLNCLSISVWEYDLDLAQQRQSFATARPSLFWLPRTACWILAGGTLIMASVHQNREICLCVAASALFLAALHHADFPSRDGRVAAADLVLMTPLLLALIHLWE